MRELNRTQIFLEFCQEHLAVTKLITVGLLTICSLSLFSDKSSQSFNPFVSTTAKATTTDNSAIRLNPIPAWRSDDLDITRSVAWGDVDNDGDLDLAVGNSGAPNKLYLNEEGRLQSLAVWSSVDNDNNYTEGLAWGDVDNDGDLDLAVGNGDAGANKLYLNDGGMLQTTAAWASIDTGGGSGIAWGDMDGDSDIDLAIGDRVYLNEGGILQTTIAWATADRDAGVNTRGVAWGDVDSDGDLDLAVGNSGGPNKLYLNTDGMLQTAASWSSIDSIDDNTQSVAWGDVDNDGDLDLAVANLQTSHKIYLNEGGQLQTIAAWTSTDGGAESNVAWGDADSDGDLDLAVGAKVYLNEGGMLQTIAAWGTVNDNQTVCAAWGDVDRDGDLDLITGNLAAPNKLYLNESIGLQLIPAWSSDAYDSSRHLAWGDIDNDDDLDLVAANLDAGKLYLNEEGKLQASTTWSTSNSPQHNAWGDVDGDGDLDLAVANGNTDQLYFNEGGRLQGDPVWATPHIEDDYTTSIAWGDVDNDSDLDLATGNAGINGVNKLYLNEGGRLQITPTWTTNRIDSDSGVSVAWGDVDNDGDLDLAIGKWGVDNVDELYLNESGRLQMTPAWTTNRIDSDDTTSVAWGDVDGDGDLDLAVGNTHGPNKLYLNEGGRLQTSAAWSDTSYDETTELAWGDMDGDGDLDLAASGYPNKLYVNEGGKLRVVATWVPDPDLPYVGSNSVAWGDMNGDGYLDLAFASVGTFNKVYPSSKPGSYTYPNQVSAVVLSLHSDAISTFSGQLVTTLAPADFYAVSGIRQTGVIPIHYSLFHPASDPVSKIQMFYSLNGGGQWYTATATNDTILTDLATSPYPTKTVTNTHVFKWDVFKSGFYGQSDNVVLRIEALPNLKPLPNKTPGPFQRPYVSTQSLPFRVRGSQVRVMARDTATPVENALVYHLRPDQPRGATPYTDRIGEPLKTDPQGYLQGRGELAQGDQLVALLPITHTANYTLYHTSATPTDVGLDAYTVNALGVQTLTVSSANPLLLFNLDVALEWDARRDANFLAQLNFDLQRTSELLYDWSNGQAALGRVRLYHDAKRYPEVGDWQPWLSAHLRIFATNRLRPSAAQGGVVDSSSNDPANAQVTYIPGQVYIGAVWNRYGEANGSLGEDWPRTLAHELSHYLFYLDDNYLGLNEDHILMSVDTCPGAMADPYRDDYSEYHPDADWLTHCAQTLSQHETGRSDWATIDTFYPMLHAPTDPFNSQPGPGGLPLAVTEIHELAPPVPATILIAPIFYIAQDGHSVQPGSSARAILFQDDWLIDLGAPTAGQIQAHGARPGDCLCLFDLVAERLGCDVLTPGDSQLVLTSISGWQPEVLVTPVTSTTVHISIGNVAAGLTLNARLYPMGAPASPAIVLAFGDGRYTGAFQLPEAVLEGYVQIWVDEPAPRREVITDYALGGNPGRIMSRGGRIMSRGGRIMSRGTRIMSRGAPIISGDGQVLLFADDLTFDVNQEWFYTIQPATVLPNPPLWASVVGRGYWLTASANAPDLTTTSIGFNYLGSDVPPGEEAYLRIHFWNGTTWQPLPTTLNERNNFAVTASQGPGLYALFTSIPVALRTTGWNVFAYPVQASRPVSEALVAISDKYTAVYGYDLSDPLDPWKLYAVGVPDWVNDLKMLEYNQVYWINARQAMTIEFKGIEAAANPKSVLPYPPATFYGALLPGAGFTPTAGIVMTAWVNDRLCGQGQTRSLNGQIVYGLDVWASDFGEHAGCGTPGALVTFQVGGQKMPYTAVWDNSQATPLLFTPTSPGGTNQMQTRLYLPMVVK